MRAAVYHGPGDLRVEKRQPPRIAPDEALLHVVGCGICGTDRRIVAGGHRSYPPGTVRIPGHEIVGEVVEIGAAVKELPTGLVFVAPNIGCGRCEQCLAGNDNLCRNFEAIGITLDGGFAEYLHIPAAAIARGSVISLKKGFDPIAPTLIEPLACVLRGQDPLHIRPEDTVLVIGAGPIGILHMMLARLKGATRILIADRWQSRLDFARRRGADIAIDVTTADLDAAVMAETAGRGADVVIIAAPSGEAMAKALALAAIGGRISYFAGLPKEQSTVAYDANLVHYKELVITGTTACSTRDCHRAAEIVNAGRLDLTPLVTRRVSFANVAEEFRAAKDRHSIKTVLVT